MRKLAVIECVFAAAAVLVSSVYAQTPSAANSAAGPQISVDGQTYTQGGLFQSNVGSPEDQSSQFPPHKIIGNIYYVGTVSLSSFLIVTPQGDILINSTFERNVPVIQKSVGEHRE